MMLSRKSSEVNKVFVGMPRDDAVKLMTETCVKCHHLIDDHLKPTPIKFIKGKMIEKKEKYRCRDCGCEIH